MEDLIDAYLSTLDPSENEEVQEYIDDNYLSGDIESLLLLSPVLPLIERDYRGAYGLWRFVWEKKDILRMIKPSEQILGFLHDNQIRYRAKFFGGRIIEELLVDKGYNPTSLRVPPGATAYRKAEYIERRKQLRQQIKRLQNELDEVEGNLKKIEEEKLYVTVDNYSIISNTTKAARK